MSLINDTSKTQTKRNSRIYPMIIFAFFLMSSCSHKMSFLTSTVVPAARGTVTVKMDENKNHSIDISLSNLAEPERLTPSKKMYIVWIVTDQGLTKNVGRIITDSGTFSKTLKADFKTVSSFTPVKIFITAENDANVQSPDWEVILTTERF
ncbi:MAG: hypothetical protein IPL55_19390 [Saprospiraceae bacterium]|nr:hypothetical protein [Saprospiraceae bacterium]